MRCPYKMFEFLPINLKWYQKLFIKIWSLYDNILCKISRRYKYRNLDIKGLSYKIPNQEIVMIYKYPNERDEMEKFCHNTFLRYEPFKRCTKNEIHLQCRGRIRIRFVRLDNKDKFRGYVQTLVVISKSITEEDWYGIFVKKPLWMSGEIGRWGYDEVTRFEDIKQRGD